MHRGRTEAESIHLSKRLYSHAWLVERGLPSGLPDHLRPPAERVHPRIIAAVGIAVKSMSGNRERAREIEAAMAEAAGDAMTSGITDPKRVSELMWEARDRLLRRF